MTDPRHTRAWRKLRAQVLREEPWCAIRGPRCTEVADTVDHVEPVSLRPDLAMVRDNLRGACRACNLGRGAGHARPQPSTWSEWVL